MQAFKCSEEQSLLEEAADMTAPGSLTFTGAHTARRPARGRKQPVRPLGRAPRGQRPLAAPAGPGHGSEAGTWWAGPQNLKRSMKCWGDTGVKQRSGSVAVQG